MIARRKIHDWIDSRLSNALNPYQFGDAGAEVGWREGVEATLHSLLDLLERDVDERIQGTLEEMGE